MKTYKEFMNEEETSPLTLSLHDVSTKVEELMKKIIKKYEKEEGGNTLGYKHDKVVHTRGNVYNYADFLCYNDYDLPAEIGLKIQDELISGIAKITKRKIPLIYRTAERWNFPSMVTKDGYDLRGDEVGGQSGGFGIYFTGNDGAGNFSRKR